MVTVSDYATNVREHIGKRTFSLDCDATKPFPANAGASATGDPP